MAESRIGWGPVCAGTTRPSVPPRRMPGSIPACAGTTPSADGLLGTSRVHPRVRGDHSGRSAAVTAGAGPSPRARGPPDPRLLERRRRGSIPACAGTTTARRRCRPAPRVHPRVRGDHSAPRPQSSRSWGPSPRARGPQANRVLGGIRRGSIPACAGTTAWSEPSTPTRRVHPRVRGDHTPVEPETSPALGPSPRARGPPTSSSPGRAGWWVHPRVRGDHPRPARRSPSSPGPSPRARGPQFVTCGFIRPGCCFCLLLEKRTYPPPF